jgi:hypothetical protein
VPGEQSSHKFYSESLSVTECVRACLHSHTRMGQELDQETLNSNRVTHERVPGGACVTGRSVCH